MTQIPMLGVIGLQQILVITLVILLLFGGKKIPELMRGLGSGIKSFKEGMKEGPTPDASEQKTEDKADKNA